MVSNNRGCKVINKAISSTVKEVEFIDVVTDRHVAAIQLTVRSSIRACSLISRGLGL